MNRKFAIGLAALALVAAGCNKNSQTSVDTSTQTTAQTQTGSQTPTQSSTSVSLQSLITAGSPVTCTYMDNGNGGTVFVASGKTHVDTTSTVNGKMVNAHMIMDGTNSYTWIDGQTNGFKGSLTATGSTSTPPSGSGSPSLDPAKAMNYNCSSWSVDNSKFTPPTNITFMDLSSLKIPGQ